MQNSFGLLILILFGGAGLISIFIVVGLMFPLPVTRIRETLEASLGRSLLLGLVNLLGVGVLDALFLWLAQLFNGVKVIGGILVVLGAAITLLLALLTFLGLASFANLLGHRIGEVKNEFNATWRGGALLFLAGLTPFAGWFVFTPLAVLTALGASIQTIFRRQAGAEAGKG